VKPDQSLTSNNLSITNTVLNFVKEMVEDSHYENN